VNLNNMGKMLVVICLGFTLMACSTASINKGESYGNWNTGELEYLEKHVFSDTRAFAPSSSDSFFMICKGEENLKRCKPMGNSKHDSAAGAISGFGSTVVSSAGIVAGAYFLGKGLGNSGNTYTDNSSVNSDNDVKGQQGQLQGQGAFAGANSSSRSNASARQGQSQSQKQKNENSQMGGMCRGHCD